MKIKLGNTDLLPGWFCAISFSLIPCVMQWNAGCNICGHGALYWPVSPEGGKPVISTFTKVRTGQISFSALNYCVISSSESPFTIISSVYKLS
jgi:hypothetical protein